ncbi:hypothetical protein XW81_01995 [Buchnera aphidicola (Schlechtendalia chinensis)]|uniref:tRNA-modifying protein YgfZ-like beta-barrel domain-containing protein n=1 Tax=Buchnera aphidicola subsp. Schlechtendalia chinensis TaxID=118110 RepID=A0A172WDY8_BUCSC|nr:tRNA-modifying protein YgfZ [Buchnera aphidicola]ANF17157.1 hypothetical protein XW81_01995 [Buchnera aphidicola (Schlechtendalia chinensis)]
MKTSNFNDEYLLKLSQKDIILTNLNNWSLIEISGSDCQKYLQNQITINVNSLNENNHKICAHCNINGKVYSNLRIFKITNNNYMYLQRKSISDKQIKEFKKYSIFSDIKISYSNDIYLLGIFGAKTKIKLSNYFKKIPNKNFPLCKNNNSILLWFNSPFERFLLITKKNDIVLNDILTLKKETNDEKTWEALDIASKFPILDKENSGKFFPQALNLENLFGLDLKKGCYYGQEMISKSHFKKLNKYKLHWLTGKFNAIVQIGTIIEIKNDITNWKKIGYVLSAVNICSKIIWIQAVLKINIKQDSIFRIESDKQNILTIQNEIFA